MKKKNFAKMLTEYEKLGDRNADLHYSYQDFSDFISLMEENPKGHRLYGEKQYVVNVHPVFLVSRAFQIGYVAALRKEKAEERKRRRNEREGTLDDLMRKYAEVFREGFPSFQVFRGRRTQECIDIVQRCLSEHKDAYELGYATDEKEVLY